MKIIYWIGFAILLLCCSASAFSQISKPDSLLNALGDLRKNPQSFSNDTVQIKILCELGKNELNLNQSEQYFITALKIAKKRGWQEGEYLSTYFLAKTYNKNGVFLPAINTFFKALFLAEQNHQFSRQGDCLQRIGDAYLMLKQFSKATEHYKRGLQIFKSLGRTINYIDCLNNFSLVYYYQRQYDQALNILYECVRLGKSVKGTIYEASYLSNIASCYRDKGNLDSALYYFDKTLAVYKLNDGKYNDLLAITLIEKARVYESLGRNDKAIELGKMAYAMNSRFYGNNLYTTEFLSKIYSSQADYKNAYKFYKEYFNAWESAQKQDREKQIESLKYEYENKQSGIKIDLLNRDISQRAFQRKILIAGLLFLVVCLIASIWSFRILKTKNRKIETQTKELARVSLELESINSTLEQQVEHRTSELMFANKELIRKNREVEEALYKGQNIERKRVASELHDNLGSTISGLIWQLDGMLMETAPPQLQTTYSNLVERMRAAYTEIRHISHNLYPSELEKYGLKVSIERLINSLNENGKIKFSLNYFGPDIEINKSIELELYAICLELLNNVIKHSNAESCKVEVTMSESQVVLEVSDNGVGLENTKTSKSGIGFSNIVNRLDAIGGKMRIAESSVRNNRIGICIPIVRDLTIISMGNDVA